MNTTLAWTVMRPLIDGVRRRLRTAINDRVAPAAARAALLQDVLGAPPTAANLAATGVPMAALVAALDDLDQVLERPTDALAAQDAGRALAAALLAMGRLVDAAAGAEAVSTLSTNAQRALNRLAASVGGPAAGGLLGQLGFADRPEVVFVQDRASLRVTSSGDQTIAGGLTLGPRKLELRLVLADASLEVEIGAPGPDSRGMNARVGLGAARGDAFLSAIISDQAEMELDLRVLASSTRGLTLGGSSSRASLAARTSTPGLQIRGIDLEIADSTPPSLAIGATILGGLTGFDATVRGLGVTLMIDAGATPALHVQPKLPTGVGIAIDAGPAHGGGFLDRAGTRYSGALQVSLGFVDVEAFGILDTNVPGGGGFSLLLVLGAQFTPAIELGLAFTLNAVGGLIGIQHEVDQDALTTGLRTGALDAVMFPTDVVRDAPRILDTLGALFPQRARSVVAGPLLRLGWGRPISFITLDVGVLLSLPDPTLTIIGRLRVAVPAPELPIVDLKVDLLGVISTDRVFLRASLIDSHIAGFVVSGDFGFLTDWSGDPTLAISAGGFHPQFHPPQLLAGMKRISVDLSPPAGLGFRADAYVALTTGSVQLGARVEMSFEAGPVSAEGHLGFDAMVQWSPRFSFQIDLNVGISVQFEGQSIAGVELFLHLEGPAPWRASGRGSFKLIFKVSFELPPITWGDEDAPSPPVISPGRLVREQLALSGSWRAVVPDGGDRFIQIVTSDGAQAETRIPVHPLGAFEVRQQVVPLDRAIVRVGASVVPPDQSIVRLGTPVIGTLAATTTSPLEDLFAEGQYVDLTDEQKLSRPAFTPMPSGLKLVASRIVFGGEVETDLAYETKFEPDAAPGSPRLIDRISMSAAVASAVGAAGRSPLRALDVKTEDSYQPFSLSHPSTLAGAA